MTKAMNNPIDVIEVLPNEALDVGVLKNTLISSFRRLIERSRGTDGSTIEKRLGDFVDFGLQEKSDIAVNDCDRVS